jgi:translation initiation factor IF-3
LPTREAQKKAEELGYDLVEVAPTSQPPVCRIMDYGKYKYEQSKKQHSTKLHQKGTRLKEIKLRPYTDKHDLEFKTQHIRDFLKVGNKVKVTLMFRGREMGYQARGREVLGKLTETVMELGFVEQPPRMEGRNMIMILSPKATS